MKIGKLADYIPDIAVMSVIEIIQSGYVKQEIDRARIFVGKMLDPALLIKYIDLLEMVQGAALMIDEWSNDVEADQKLRDNYDKN